MPIANKDKITHLICLKTKNNTKAETIKAIGIKFWNWLSKVNAFVIQYKLEIKYPSPNNQPILNDSHLFLLKLDTKKIKKSGNEIKFIIIILYGVKLKDVIKPNKKGNK